MSESAAMDRRDFFRVLGAAAASMALRPLIPGPQTQMGGLVPAGTPLILDNLGVRAEGGYLVPDRYAEQILRDHRRGRPRSRHVVTWLEIRG